MLDFTSVINRFSKKSVRLYLILANFVMTVFAIWFFNLGVLPFKNIADFAFFSVLILIFAIYRPGWAFVIFIGSLALENINLAPAQLIITVRPYQLLGAMILSAVVFRLFAGRKVVTFPKLKWYDGLPIIFALGGFLSGFLAVNKNVSLKQALVATSFAALYFLVRMYIQSSDDLKRIAPFFLSSGLVVSIYAIWQNVRFISGKTSFEVMAGRPNATFTEPDWLGIYLVFLLSIILTIIYHQNKRTKPDKIIQAMGYGLWVIIFVALILTVSRSAWLGALAVALVFLKITLLYGETSIVDKKSSGFWSEILFTIRKSWFWKKFFGALGGLISIFIISLGIIHVFHLTNFQLGNRAQSTGGFQKITIACKSDSNMAVPQTIKNVDELANYQCRHINLENIEQEKALGNNVGEVYRPDPNVGIRARIYATAIEQIKKHPLGGIGWGSISKILGTDERGAGLNASNVFLEIWLGSGLLGFLSLLILFGYLFFSACLKFVKSQGSDISAVFVLLGLVAVIIPNLFNSGIFLGFVWVYLATAVGLFADVC